MKITNHRLDGAPFVKANVYGSAFPAKPTVIVLHDTAGRLEKGNSVAWFKSAACTQASAHFVVERDGSVTQCVPCDRVAWHAGASEFQGRHFVNNFSFGIEIVSPGELRKVGDKARAYFKQEWPLDEVEMRQEPTHGNRQSYWLPYTPEQIEATTELCRALIAAYPTIKSITTHWFISPGRKIDPSPLFPVEEVAHAAFSQPHMSDESAVGPGLALPAAGHAEEPLVIPAADAEKPAKAGVMALFDTAERNYAKLNELADKGSRAAAIVRRVKNWFWGIVTLLTGSCSMLDTKKGTAHLFVKWVEAHPFLFVAICGTVLGVALYFAAKAFEKYIVTAYRDGRYTPRG